METGTAHPYSHSLIDAGIDWITATKPADDDGYKWEQLGESLLQEQKEQGRTIRRATLRDYVGFRGEHLFVGTREADSIIVGSSDVSASHWQSISSLARNVSRLDIQASVWTHGEQPQLGRYAFARLKRAPKGRGRPREFDLRRKHPYGETLSINNRVSDAYGRLYDWGAAHKAATAQTVWRYEVEFKRSYALGHARTLLSTPDPRTTCAQLVHGWFSKRGVVPSWSATATRLPNVPALTIPDRDPLAWFRSSLSVTIRKAIDRHGLDEVLMALGLSDVVQPKGR